MIFWVCEASSSGSMLHQFLLVLCDALHTDEKVHASIGLRCIHFQWAGFLYQAFNSFLMYRPDRTLFSCSSSAQLCGPSEAQEFQCLCGVYARLTGYKLIAV